MKIVGVEKEEQNAENAKNNTQIKAMSMVKNQSVSKITWENHYDLTVVTSLISDRASRYKRKYEAS